MDALDALGVSELGFKNQGLDDILPKYWFWSLLVMSCFHFGWCLFQGFSATTIFVPATDQQWIRIS